VEWQEGGRYRGGGWKEGGSAGTAVQDKNRTTEQEEGKRTAAGQEGVSIRQAATRYMGPGRVSAFTGRRLRTTKRIGGENPHCRK